MNKEKVLLDQARVYIFLARILHKHGHNGHHYLLEARKCILEVRKIEYNELTRFIKLAA